MVAKGDGNIERKCICEAGPNFTMQSAANPIQKSNEK